MRYMLRLGVLAVVAVGSIAVIGCGDDGRRSRTVYAPADRVYFDEGYYYDDGYYYGHRRYDYDRDRRAYRLDIRDDNRRDVYRRDVDRRDVGRRDIDRRDVERRDVSGGRGRR